MKSGVIALFLGSAAAIRDAPPFFNEPTWNEKMPSAGGFLQVSSCINAGVAGVTCVPNSQLFATGMNGDEDMGEDIIMKGEPYHYTQKKESSLVQWNPVDVASTGALPNCHGNNGPDGTNCDREVCSGTNGPMDGPSGTPCTREQPAAVPHYNTDPTAGRPYQTSGDITATSPEATSAHSWPASQTLVQMKDDAVSAEAEKVSVLQTPYGHTHTSFY
jgi:hypothetical protein